MRKILRDEKHRWLEVSVDLTFFTHRSTYMKTETSWHGKQATKVTTASGSTEDMHITLGSGCSRGGGKPCSVSSSSLARALCIHSGTVCHGDPGLSAPHTSSR